MKQNDEKAKANNWAKKGVKMGKYGKKSVTLRGFLDCVNLANLNRVSYY